MNWGRLAGVSALATFDVLAMVKLAQNLDGCRCRITDPTLIPVVGGLFAIVLAGITTLVIVGSRRDP